MLESVPCELCGRTDAPEILVKNGWRLVRCACGLVYLDPRPDEDGARAIYVDEKYFEAHIGRNDEECRQQARTRLKLLERFVPGRGRLLDVGCSTGWFLDEARAAGWQATGLDVSPRAVDEVRAIGLDARVGTIEACRFAEGSFEAVTMFDSLEHMSHPLAALAAARRLLAPGGVLMISTPNLDGLFPRVTWQLFARTLGAWEHAGPPAHLYQFSRRTLEALLARAGFREEHVRTEAIALDHTVGALEEAIIGAMRGPEGAGEAAAVDKPPPPKGLRRLTRAGVRAMCWGMAMAIAAPAPLLELGDSLVVLATIL